MAIDGGMYGLSPADCMANIRLVPYLVQHGYHQSKRIPALFKHETRPIAFVLIVDDFGVKYTLAFVLIVDDFGWCQIYVGEENVKHLDQVLKQEYTITTDWSGALYSGIHLRLH